MRFIQYELGQQNYVYGSPGTNVELQRAKNKKQIVKIAARYTYEYEYICTYT